MQTNLEGLFKEFIETAKDFKSKYELSPYELGCIISLESLFNKPENLEKPESLKLLTGFGHEIGLFSVCGEGSPFHFCMDRNDQDKIIYKYRPWCGFMLYTTYIPTKTLNSGFLACENKKDYRINWGILGSGTSLDEYCKDVRFHEKCMLNQFRFKVKRASTDEITQAIRRVAEKNNEKYAKYSKEVFEKFNSLIMEGQNMIFPFVSQYLGVSNNDHSDRYIQ